jgi:hypothetical protein
MAGKRFHYALEPLRLKSEWDMDAAQRELAQVSEQVRAQQSAVDELTAAYNEAREGRRPATPQIAPLMLQLRSMEQAYLQQAAHRVLNASRRLDELSQEQQRSLQQTVKLHKYRDNLDRDRSQRQDEHRRSVDASIARDAEELWLQRHHGKEARHEA